ncbi:alpha/beta hydrolase [Microbacterium sp. Mu-80]|uniref:Alpha/beta hydrolase n=1 Tax=Microbacterium bandirmense TaxID=3122050 RepID=A0ABU8LAR1_9MICO
MRWFTRKATRAKPDSADGAHDSASGTAAQTEEPAARRRPRLGRTVLVLAPALAGFVAGAVVFSSSVPVGHFRSADGQDEYLAAYERALDEGPAESARVTIETEYGAVHAVRYDSADPTRADADPLVLLPGTQSGAPMWVNNIPSLRAAGPVYVIDLLGQPGRSIQSRPIETHADDARWLAQALDQLPGHPAVMGHSLGGWLAINLAVHEPGAASRVIVLDPVMSFEDLSLPAVVRSIPASVSWLPKSWRDDFASWTANDAPIADEPVAEMIEAGMQHFSLGTPAPSRFSDEQLQHIDAPMLAIMAGASRMHDAEQAADNAEKLLTHGVVLTYDDASHAINGEEPERIAEDVTLFLED